MTVAIRRMPLYRGQSRNKNKKTLSRNSRPLSTDNAAQVCCKQVPLSKRRAKSSNAVIQKTKNSGHTSDEDVDAPLRVYIKVTAPKPLVTNSNENSKKSNDNKDDKWLLSHHVSNIERDKNLPGYRYMDYRQRKDKETVKALRRCKSSKPDLTLKTTKITKDCKTEEIHPQTTQIPIKREVPIKKSEDKVRKMIPHKSTTDLAADYSFVRSNQSYINNQLYSPPLTENGFLLKENGKLQTCVFYMSKQDDEKENRIKTHAHIINEKTASPRRDPAPTRIPSPSPHPNSPCTSNVSINVVKPHDSCRSVGFESSKKQQSHLASKTKIHRTKTPEAPRAMNMNKSEPRLDNIMKIGSKLDYMMVKPETYFDYVLKAESKIEGAPKQDSKSDGGKEEALRIRYATGRRSETPEMNISDVVGGLLRIKNDRKSPVADMNFTDVLGGIFAISSQKPLEGQKEQKKECANCKKEKSNNQKSDPSTSSSPLRPSSPVLTKSEQRLFNEDEIKRDLKPNQIKKKKSNIKEKCDRLVARKSTPDINKEFPEPKITKTKKVVKVPSENSLYDYRTVILPYKSCQVVFT